MLIPICSDDVFLVVREDHRVEWGDMPQYERTIGGVGVGGELVLLLCNLLGLELGVGIRNVDNGIADR